MKLKGRYVALVEVDYEVEPKVSAQTVRERLSGTWVTEVLADKTRDMFDKNADVKVTTQLADVYEVME